MTWLHPWGLLGLVSVPVLVALSLWRRQRREVVASSLLLWRQVARQRRRAPATQPRRRIDPLLAARVAVALVLAGALCGPVWRTTRPVARTVALVADRSASMAARAAGRPSRWEACRDQLLRLIGRLEPGDRVHLFPLPAPSGVPSGAFAGRGLDPGEAASVLRRLEPSDAPLEPHELVEAAADAVGRLPGARVVLATDAPVSGLPRGVAALATGGPLDNRGIVAFAARQGRDGRHEVLVRVANAAARPAEARVALLADGRPLGERTLSLPARGRAQVFFTAALGAATTLEARLEGRDDLAVDDRAWLARRGEPVRVALVGQGAYPLRRALDAVGHVELVELVRPPDESVPSGCDLAVYYRTVPKKLGRGRAVVVAPEAAVGRLRPLEAIDGGQVSVVAPRDRLMPSVSFEGLTIGKVARVAAPPGFEVLASAGTAPAIGRWQAGEAVVVYVGIDPAGTDWPLHVSFPIFWANVVASARGGLQHGTFCSCRPGELCRLGVAGPTLVARGPQGSAVEVSSGVFRPERAGLYTAEADGGRRSQVAVSLLSEAETMTVGSWGVPEGKVAGREQRPAAASMRHLAGWMVLAGLVLVLLHAWRVSRAAEGRGAVQQSAPGPVGTR